MKTTIFPILFYVIISAFIGLCFQNNAEAQDKTKIDSLVEQLRIAKEECNKKIKGIETRHQNAKDRKSVV